MPSLPIPMIVAILLIYLAIITLARRDRPWPFVLLILACAVQGTVISLNQHYGVTLFHTVQPVTATLIPPLAWIIFQVTAIRAFAPSRHLPHLLLPAFVAFCMAFAPQVLDIIIPTGFVAYGVALLIVLKQGPGNLPLPRLESGERPGLIWRVIALALIASAFSDILILLDQMLGQGRLQAWIIGVFSSLILLALGALCLSRSLEGEPNEACPAAETTPVMDLEQNRALMERLDHLVTSQTLFLDPGLTLSRLSRKLGVPSKLLSSTINQTTGENVSRYINAYRIEHACLQLESGESVTSAMLNSGFNTKSNFNREFRRVKGHAPREWQAAQTAPPD